MPGHPDGGGYAHGGVGAGDKADEHDQSEVLRGVAAKEIEGRYAEEGGGQCVQGTANGLMNGVVRQFREAVCALVGVHGFADTVEDDDGFIHGVAQDRQDSRQEGGIHFQMEESKDAEYHEDIMADSHDGREGDAMLETNGHVKNHSAEGENDVQEGILRHFGADDSADGFDTLHVCFAHFFFHVGDDGLRFFCGEVAGADDHIIAGLALHISGKLNGGGFQAVLTKAVTYFFDGYIFREAQFQNGAAGEVDAPVKGEERQCRDR